MAQELIQEMQKTEKVSYNEWLRSLKAKVEQTQSDEQEELQWRLRYGKT